MRKHDQDQIVRLLLLEKERSEFWEKEWQILTLMAVGVLILSGYLFGDARLSLGLVVATLAVVAIGWRLHGLEKNRAETVRRTLEKVVEESRDGAGASPAFG